MNKKWLKSTAEVIGVFGVAMLIAAMIPNKARAELDSMERNPGKDKMIEERVSEFGTAMKLWAIGFGAEAEKNAVESKQAFLNDVDRIKNSEFVRYQRDGWEQGKKDLAQTKQDIRDLFSSMGRALDKVFGGSDAE